MDICVCVKELRGGERQFFESAEKKRKKKELILSQRLVVVDSHVCCVDPNKNWPQQTIQVEGENVIEKRIFSYKNVCIKNLRAF